MTSEAPAAQTRRRRPVEIAPVVMGTALVVVYLSWALTRWRIAATGFDGWGIGDWLISYDGGFVRRGLFGTIVLNATPADWSVVTTTALVQIALMGLLFALLFTLYLRTERSLTWAMVLLSPAALLFPIAVANQQAGTRKELVILVALALTAVGFRRDSWRWWTLAGFLTFTLAVWSHEAAALLTPAFIYLVYTGAKTQPARGDKWRWLAIAGFGVMGALAIILSVLHPGSPASQQAICDAWAARGIATDCQSYALGFLTHTTEEAVEWFQTKLFPWYWEYLAVVALAALPLYAVRFLPRRWKAALVILVFLAPLFYVAWDYGRWIYLATMALSTLALAQASSPHAPVPMEVPVIGIIAYCLLWAFPGFANEPPVVLHGWLIDWLEVNLPTAWF